MATATATMSGEMSFRERPISIFAEPDKRMSTFTDILEDSDWEDDSSEAGSIFEEDSPRGSFDTLDTVDEAPTPAGSIKNVAIQGARGSVSGPSGPHLFRASFDSTDGADLASPLQMSPLLPKEISSLDRIMMDSPSMLTPRAMPPAINPSSDDSHSNSSQEDVVRTWSAEQVTEWMYTMGFEQEVIEKFEEHDIDGNTLMDLHFGDLKELDITSFGQRHSVWSKLAALRAVDPTSPAHTVIEDVSRSAVSPTKERGTRSSSRRRKQDGGLDTPLEEPKKHRLRRNKRSPFDEALTPAESVSIVAIEQLMGKPHYCKKGVSCPKYRRQERLRKQIEKENAVSPGGGGQIYITGDFEDLAGDKIARGLREAEPSVIASSDLLGANQPTPKFSMDNDMQRKMQQHQAQDSVKQYLTLQQGRTGPVDALPTPPLETPMFNNVRDNVPTPRFAPSAPVNQPPQPAPMVKLQQLPKLSIPRSASVGPRTATSARSPRLAAMSPATRMRSPLSTVQVAGSHASMDLPMRSMTLTPIPRDMSQTVPPNMHFRAPTKHRGSRDPSTWQRASMKLPLIPEHSTSSTTSSTLLISPTREPIKVSHRVAYGGSCSHAGYMRKRKTKLLRHEWAEHHFRLQGTKLAMHASARPDDRKALDTINIDDFTIACSSVSSDSKLAAALKSLRISSEKKGKKEAGLDDAAFVFQLIPAGDRKKVISMLKDMKVGGAKTHHFAVKGREDRIDWMREVMLAKAKKGKEGYEVTINGEKLC